MKLISTNHIELSYSNLKALVDAFENGDATSIVKITDEGPVKVSVAHNEDHYTPEELADRMNPYMPPEAWAGK